MFSYPLPGGNIAGCDRAAQKFRALYDNPAQEALLDEQAQIMPRGPLGVLLPPDVQIVEGPEREGMAVLADYFAGRIGLMDVLGRLDAMKQAGQVTVLKP